MGAKDKVIEARLLARDKQGKPIETIPEMYRRVAKGISDSLEHEEKVHGLLTGNFFFPNSPTIANAGRGLSMSACFVLPVEDSMEGIFDAIKWGALVHKAGGGTGYSFSSLRPGGAVVSSTGREASGVLSSMSAFDAATETVRKGGVRRGANIGVLRVDHMEIEAFIDAKKNDLTKLTNFNMSVGITDEFMRAVRGNKMFKLQHPKGGGKEVNARDLFDKLIDAAWTTGEPGIVFLDQMNYWNPTPSIGEYQASNPCGEVPLLSFESCLASGTKILTDQGWRNIENIKVGDKVSTLKEGYPQYSSVSAVANNGVKPVYRITAHGGYSIRATANHRFLSGGVWKRVDELAPGDPIDMPYDAPFSVPDYKSSDFDEMIGWVHGDGSFSKAAIGITFNKKDGDFAVKDRLSDIFVRVFNAHKIKPMRNDDTTYQYYISHSPERDMILDRLGIPIGNQASRVIPSYLWDTDINRQSSFLRGLFTADGSVGGKSNRQIHFASTSLRFIQEIQILLIRFGIKSRIYSTDFGPDSNRKPQHRLTLTKNNSLRFVSLIGFCPESAKNDKVTSNKCRDFTEDNGSVIDSIVEDGEAEVFDLSVPDGEHFIANGFMAHNCTLGSIVLSAFCTKDKSIDWDSLREAIGISVRALDNVISANTYILPQIEEATKLTRKIGLGVMGFADLCIMMGIRYGSDKSIKLARQVMSYIQLNAFLASIDLAKEKGAFPAFEDNKDRMLDILDRRMASWKRYWPKLVNEKISTRMERYGIRNATLTTVAPTGTLSIIAECSSGIEPVFAFEMNHGGLDGTVGKIVHPLFAAWKTANNVPGVPLPNYFVEAHQVPPNEHLAIQAAFQEFTCNSISKTINLPKDATKETIEDIILSAHKLDLKGLTVYRDGARQNVLSGGVGSDGKVKRDSIKGNGSVKRGRRLTGETLRNELPCGKFYQVFNFTEDNDLAEVFFEMGKSGGCVKMLLEALGRTISVSLRSGVTPESIAKNLSGLSCDKTIWEDGKCFKSCMDIAAHNMIETMKLHGVKVEEVKEVAPGVPTCPECGTIMVIEESCSKCPSCGHSDCGGK